VNDRLRRLQLALQRAFAAIRTDPFGAAASLFAFATMAAMIAVVTGPWFKDLSTFGFHDWDVQTAHRYLVRLSLLRYHELPAWNPFACGGFPAWGYVEADTIVVSPFLPAYLLLPMSVALRVEVVGMAALGALGAYFAASRFSESRAARAFVAVIWAVNGRWALQAAAGHTWHLAYAYLPWCLYFFERARSPERRIGDVAGLAAGFAMLVYAGGIYPLPHTVLALSIYAGLLALLERSARPLFTLVEGGLFGVGLSAPKLFPLLDGFGKAPRLIESKETMDLGALWAMLMSPDQGFYSRPARVMAYGWHEWGMYIGAAGALALVLGFVFVQGRREAALKAVAALFIVLGFGAFHPDAPWPWLHQHAPVFRSQHVPSRFFYTAVLFLGLVVAAGAGRFIARRRAAMPWLDALAMALVAALAMDVAHVARKPMEAAMWMVPPDRIPGDRPFHFAQEPPFQYKRRDWAGPMYLAMLGNTGVINCYGAPPFDRKGARAVTDPRYRGEAYVVGRGEARVVSFSPNRAVIEVEGAEPGALVVYNMNYDEGWRADAGAVIAHDNAVALRLGGDSQRITFSYRPPYLGAGLAVGALALAALALRARRERRAR